MHLNYKSNGTQGPKTQIKTFESRLKWNQTIVWRDENQINSNPWNAKNEHKRKQFQRRWRVMGNMCTMLFGMFWNSFTMSYLLKCFRNAALTKYSAMGLAQLFPNDKQNPMIRKTCQNVLYSKCAFSLPDHTIKDNTANIRLQNMFNTHQSEIFR